MRVQHVDRVHVLDDLEIMKAPDLCDFATDECTKCNHCATLFSTNKHIVLLAHICKIYICTRIRRKQKYAHYAKSFFLIFFMIKHLEDIQSIINKLVDNYYHLRS